MRTKASTAKLDCNEEPPKHMKNVSAKMFISLAGVALVAPFMAFAVFVGARAVASAHSTDDQLLLVVLAGVAGALSILNGFGQRTRRAAHTARNGRVEANAGARVRRASVIHLGY